MEVNTVELRQLIKRRNITQTRLSKLLGIDRWTLYSRLGKNKGKTFKLKEVFKIIEVLNLTDSEILKVFFNRGEDE